MLNHLLIYKTLIGKNILITLYIQNKTIIILPHLVTLHMKKQQKF